MKILNIIPIILTVIIILTSTSCSKDGSITGVVKDSRTHSPLKDVIVTIDAGEPTSTDVDGKYSFTGLSRANYVIQYKKTYYYSGMESIKNNGKDKDVLNCFLEMEPGTLPIVTTDEVFNITSTSVSVKGTIESFGGTEIDDYGHVWSISTTPDVYNDVIWQTNFGATQNVGEFTSGITALQPNTTYFVRSYVKYVTNVAYGKQIEFTTSAK